MRLALQEYFGLYFFKNNIEGALGYGHAIRVVIDIIQAEIKNLRLEPELEPELELEPKRTTIPGQHT